MNDFNNPYSAPQTQPYPTSGMPTAAYVLPAELRTVADGLKLCLWAIIVLVVGIVAVAILGGVMGANANGPDQVLQNIRTFVFIGLAIGIVSGLLRVMGLWKCTTAPAETNAQDVAKIAFFSGIGALAVDILSNVMQLSGVASGLQIVGLLGTILSITTLVSFVMFLSRMANYLQDAYLLAKTKSLTLLAYVLAACLGITVVIGLLVPTQIQPNGRPNAAALGGAGILAAVLGLVMFVCGIWAFIVYVQTISRMSKVIEAGTR